MCQKGKCVPIFMNDHWGGRFWNIDSCLAPLVQMLLELHIDLIQACCGHGEKPIQIVFSRGKNDAAYDIVRGLEPDILTPVNESGTITAAWHKLPEQAMAAMGSHYYGDGTITDRQCTTMFIYENRHSTWWHDMPILVYPLVQMLRQLGVHTVNSATPPSPEGICLWFNRGPDNIAYKTVKKFSPDELTPPDHTKNHVAVWKKSPISRLLAEQGNIRGFS